MAKTEEIILKEIECPVCFNEMFSSIIMCRNGHNICGTCVKRLSKCPICKELFMRENTSLQAVANKVKILREQMSCSNNNQSPWEFFDEHHVKLTIAEEVSKIVLTDLKCKDCQKYTFSCIKVCHNGHSSCHACRKCTKCYGFVRDGRNFALEAIAASLEYPCRYKKLGCAAILTISQAHHETVCQYKPKTCPLSDAEIVNCGWLGTSEDLKHHLTQQHIECYVFEGTFLTLNIMYSSNSVLFALNRVFVISIVMKNGSMFYRLYLEGPSTDTDKFKCVHTLMKDGNVVTTVVFSPSPNWMEFSGGVITGHIESKLILNVEICKA